MDDGYRGIFESHPRPMWIVDRETSTLLAVNDAGCTLFGRARDELVGHPAPPSPRELRHFDTTFAGRAAILVTASSPAERRFRLLVEHSADGISVVGTDRKVRYISPNGARILGLEPGALVGEDARVLTHPDDRQFAPVKTNELNVYRSRSRHRDGSWRWIEATATDLRDDPDIRGFISTFRDVTPRIEAERSAVDARARLEYLLSATSAMTYTGTASGQITWISSNVETILGYTAAEYIADGGMWLRCLHPDDHGLIGEATAKLFDTGRVTVSYRFRHADGSYRVMQDDARLVRRDDGDEIVGTWIDITERRRAEDALRTSELNFRTLMERNPIATFVHADLRVVYANPAMAVLLRYGDPSELVGNEIFDHVYPSDTTLVGDLVQATRAHGTSSGECRVVRKDGSLVAIYVEGIRLEFDGRPAHVVFAYDINERRDMFARFAVADRMLSLGTLAAGVAHEINNPLAFVASNLAVLATELPALAAGSSRLSMAEVQTMLADARTGASRVSAIVRDLRSLARADDDASGPVDVTSVLASSIRMAHNELRHRARVVTRFDALPAVRGSESRLGQVFLNLLVNAGQAIPAGHADKNEVRVRATNEGNAVVVEVEDTGVGISPHIMSRIFDPFFTTKPVGVSTGLGLAICHQIVRRLGGDITVTSTPAAGSCFRVTLPASPDAPASTAAPPTPTSVPRSRILMIDDEAMVGRATRVLLAPEHDVTALARGADALAVLATDDGFDVVLCDLMMPEMSGMELYERVRDVAPHYIDRFVFMTGGAFTPEARAFVARLDRPTVAKPFEIEDLERAISGVRR